MAKAAKTRQVEVRRWLAQNLKIARTMLGMTQEQLAEKANLDRTQIGAIERQTNGASIDSLAELASAVGVAAHVLLMPPAEAQPIILEASEKARLLALAASLPKGKKLHL